MNTLLKFNNDAALVGDMVGRIYKETRPSDLSPKEWEEQLRSKYQEPGHGYRDADGVSITRLGGRYQYADGREIEIPPVETFESYQVFSDEPSGLSVVAVFLTSGNEWIVADKEREIETSNELD